ncbi:MAG: hypothetical protein RR324_09910 [Cellulosilyticaceae bacterium]|uniref:hypothetical protein n=1 Tax=Niameybacter sp. TaxID=2033640 RepID=UPI002FC8F7E5
MKIYYIRPKTTKPKSKSIKLYSSSLLTFFTLISRVRDPELMIILILVVLLAIAAAAQQAVISNNQTDKWDKKLKAYEKRKKIEKMLEDTSDKTCNNVDVKNLI